MAPSLLRNVSLVHRGLPQTSEDILATSISPTNLAIVVVIAVLLLLSGLTCWIVKRRWRKSRDCMLVDGPHSPPDDEKSFSATEAELTTEDFVRPVRSWPPAHFQLATDTESGRWAPQTPRSPRSTPRLRPSILVPSSLSAIAEVNTPPPSYTLFVSNANRNSPVLPLVDVKAKVSTPVPARVQSFVLSRRVSFSTKQDASKVPLSSTQPRRSLLPRLMTVCEAHDPTLDDELIVREGDVVRLLHEYEDNWCMAQLVGWKDAPKGILPRRCLGERKPLGGRIPTAVLRDHFRTCS